jgi:hypothetical protein
MNVSQIAVQLPYRAGTTEETYDHLNPFLDNLETETQSEMLLGTRAQQAGIVLRQAVGVADVAAAQNALHHLYDAGSTDPLTWSSVQAAIDAKAAADAAASTTAGAAAASASDVAGPTIPHSLADLLHSEDAARLRTMKHQHAMLDIAVMWMRVHNYTMALSAVEEGMKTAHQRGDHAAVATALLLLHRIFRHAHSVEQLAAAEDILLRCINRCAALSLQYLTAQATLLVVHLRSTRRLRHPASQMEVSAANGGDYDPEALAGEASGLGYASTAAGLGTYQERDQEQGREQEQDLAPGDVLWTLSDLWTQLGFALLGEITLTCQVVRPQGITHDSEFTQSSASSSAISAAAQQMLAMQQQQQGGAGAAGKKDAQLLESPLAHSDQLVELSLQACVIAADLWMRSGMLHMAEFNCRRTLRQFSHIGTSENLIPVYSRLLVCRTDILFFHSSQVGSCVTTILAEAAPSTSSSSSSSSSSSIQYKKLLQLARHVRALFPSVHPRALSQQLEYAATYVLAHAARDRGQWDKALRLGYRLVALSESASSSSSCSYSSNAAAAGGAAGDVVYKIVSSPDGSATGGEAAHVTSADDSGPGSSDRHLSVENIRARLFLAQVMMRFDSVAGQQLLRDLLSRCKSTGNTFWASICRAVHASCVLQCAEVDG